MKIEIVAKNYNVTTSLNETLTKKISKLDKFFEDDAKCRVYLKSESKFVKMEVEFAFRGATIRAEAKSDNFYDAVDIVVPKLEKQIAKQRTKLESKLRKGSLNDLVFEDYEDNFRLVKTKQFEISPLSVELAISEFELLGHNFYVFCDEADMRIKVLYLRDDGNVGLIDPIVTK